MIAPAPPDSLPRRRPQLGTFIGFAIISVVWGSTWLVIKDQISVVPPAWTITWRFALAGVAMAALAWLRREPLRLPAGGQGVALLVAVTQFVLNYQFVYRAEHYLTSGLVAVLFALLMVPNAILSARFLGTALPRQFLLGSALAVVGIGLLVLHELRLAAVAGNVGLGIGLSVAGLLAASVANVAQAAPRGLACRPVPLLAVAMLWGTLFNALWAFISEGPPVFDPRPAYAGGVAYLAIVGSVLPFPLYTRLIREVGAGNAAYTSVVTPIVAMLLSTLFEGYRWTTLAVAGSVLAMCGMIIALAARRS